MTSKIQNNTLQKVRKVITTIKEIDVNNEMQTAFSIAFSFYKLLNDDQDFHEEILKNQLKVG